MVHTMRDLLDLPDRTAKPRQDGITHVLDKGLSIAEVDGMVEVAGASVDIVKLGWGTAVATQNLGGTLTELAIARGRLDELVGWARDLGLGYFEISDGTISLEHERKLELIAELARDFTVLSEVGSKDDTGAITPPYRWVEMMLQELEAGAWKVIA